MMSLIRPSGFVVSDFVFFREVASYILIAGILGTAPSDCGDWWPETNPLEGAPGPPQLLRLAKNTPDTGRNAPSLRGVKDRFP